MSAAFRRTNRYPRAAVAAVALLLACAVLTGCELDMGSGSSDSVGGSCNQRDTPNLQSYLVDGTSDIPPTGVLAEPIDPKENDGRFTIYWQADSPIGFKLRLRVNRSSTYWGPLTPGVTFYQNRYRSGDAGAVHQCRFDSHNNLCCDGQCVNLTDYFERLPERDYLHWEGCVGNDSCRACVYTSRPVEFR